MKSKIMIITTDGPIALRYSSLAGGISSAVSGVDLNKAIPQLTEIAEIEVMEFADLPGAHMTIAKMYKLAKTIDDIALRDDVDGFVVTHGPDTLEETAYFLDLALKTEKLVCLTSVTGIVGDISIDGLRNLLASVRTACCAEAHQRGVLVVSNEEIHAAREVQQTYSAGAKSFTSPYWGPLGYIDYDSVVLRRSPLTIQKIFPKKLVEDVYLLKMAIDSDDYLLRALIKKPAAGIVIEGFGRGSVPPAIVPALQEAVSSNIPVVLTTRAINGRTAMGQRYDGTVKQLREIGIIMAGEINGPKARIKLILALGAKCSQRELAQLFNYG